MTALAAIKRAAVRISTRLGVVGQFALASLIPIVVLGVVLAQVLQHTVRDRALHSATQSADIIGTTLVQPMLRPSDFAHGLNGVRLQSLERLLRSAVASGELARVKVWNTTGKVIYASDHQIIGSTFEPEDRLAAALKGTASAGVSDLNLKENAQDRSFGKLLEIYIPLRFGSERTPTGAFEIYIPYRPIAAAITHDTDQIYLILLGGLILLYLALFKIAASTSSKLRRQSSENRYLALHDTLTGLPNRELFRDRTERAIAIARRDQRSVGLLLLDIDRFKEVNDTLGHANGDTLLQEVGERIKTVLRESDSVARLGGDEFGLLLTRLEDSTDALTVAAKVREVLRNPFVLDGVDLDVHASIGVAIFPDHGDDTEQLLQRADVAMYLAKDEHADCIVYSPARDRYSPARLSLVAQLRRAIAQGELKLHYQPKAELRSGTIIGAEALVRWDHPERGLLLPAEFVPLAEHTGLIRDLTQYVLCTALEQLRDWQTLSLPLCVSANLSARDVLDENLPDTIADLLRRYHVPPKKLELELTESVLLTDPEKALQVLVALREMGIKVAIDDFGTGYSSLGYLKRLPVNEIKIDRSFVLNMQADDSDAVIVQSTIELAHNLGLTVVAEGVETAETWVHLNALHCDVAQGYYLSRAVPPDELVALIAKSRDWQNLLTRAEIESGQRTQTNTLF